MERTYCPDFYIPKENKFIEIKGRPKKDFDLMIVFIEEHNYSFEMISPDDYKNLKQNYSDIILGWENG